MDFKMIRNIILAALCLIVALFLFIPRCETCESPTDYIVMQFDNCNSQMEDEEYIND